MGICDCSTVSSFAIIPLGKIGLVALLIVYSDFDPAYKDKSGSEVIKLFSCSTQLSMKFRLLLKTKVAKITEVSCLKSLNCCMYHANKGYEHL